MLTDMNQTVKKGQGATSKRSRAMKPLTKAQQKLVTDNIAFAMNLGTKYAALGSFNGIPVEDLQQEACYGLCIAAQRWGTSPQSSLAKDEVVDTSAIFQTYALNWCTKFIMMAIDDVPLDALEDNNVEEIDIIDDNDEQTLAEERARKVEAMLAVLNRHEKKVVRLLYGFDGESKDFYEIAKLMHIHVARVHQIYEKARTKMEWSLS